VWERNVALADLEALPVPGVGPEDVAVDADGRYLTRLDDGRICRISDDARHYEIVADTGGRPLGIEHRDDGQLIVCDARRGLLRVDPSSGEVEALVAELDGRPLLFTNNAALHPDGSVLFTDSSRRFGIDHYKADLLEHSSTGRLLRWREGGDVEVLLDGLSFANGVALTHDGDAVIVAETGAYRLTRYWLAGDRAGQHEVLLDNLPGFPDNLSTGPSGTVWVAIVTTRNPLLDFLLPRPPILRKAAWAMPEPLQPSEARVAFVSGIDFDGTVTHNPAGPR
jgi:sugar lactone lactonase YvrE